MESNTEKKRLPRIGLIGIGIITIVSLLVGGIGGFLIYRSIEGLNDDERKIIDEYRILEDEWLFGDEDIITDALSGLASGIASEDSFTFYTSTMEEQNLSVRHLGFGFSSRTYDGGLYLSEIHDGTAKKAGLREGDVLYGVQRNNEEYYDFREHKPDAVQAYLQEDGHDEDNYTFHYVRNGEEGEVTLKKGSYEENIVTIEEEPTLLNQYTLALRIAIFLGSPTKEVKRILDTYLSQGKKIQRLVIDLRGNGGGKVNECDAMARLFVKKGTLIYELHDQNDNVIERSTQQTDPTYDIPKFDILLDKNSASASETFTLAMRAGTDCAIHGFTSYGKGIAQKFHTFDDGSVIRYTYAYVYGPEKENETLYDEAQDDDKILCIQGKGIVPDVVWTPDYQWLATVPNLLDSLAISESGQNYVLNLLNEVLDEDKTYRSDYHFVDAIKDFSAYAYDIYKEEALLQPFDSKGRVSLPLFNKITKISYDLYVRQSDALLEDTIDDR